ncbi:MAG: nucleotidyltransferase domain-containing protein [Candidatus Omnitrophota bacterium]|nr:MAG: nucleotidyltransferase domain-containing protein [Candidatus Omnitrophota bacterium]
MKNREKEILNKVVAILKKELNPAKIILFGSRAKGINDNAADFDLAVDCKRPDVSQERRINEEIEKISGLYKVDIAYLKSVDAEFKKNVLKTGKVVYERRHKL